ncbi:glucose-1-phosphate cytidylyltransferase [Rhodoblastus acidophilus]|uniref:glucose-1-phosphate cytidylyltransferase n=1 Tax=Rhodoblastus acidophilus TaxID=1074 RepID=UPI002225780B|nr:glucose-1-phosphate cytidylyltransferase [Rhodoblastus acidophilus]MCW2314978.1 glucose-1-phosphate cytidylyltransferase [Rhodoblastus acidophilus]
MKVVILTGGMGTRLAEETAVRPKPMVEIGGRPILWHIMKIYSAHGFNEFVICLGHRGYYIKEFFSNYFLHMSDVTFDMRANRMDVHRENVEPWRVTLIDTGEKTMTGGRIKRIRDHLGDDDVFALTYGDGVGDVDLTSQLAFHRAHGKLATVTAVRPAKRFGALRLDGDRVTSFTEKPDDEGGWISGGFFLLSPKVCDLIEGDDTVWEREPMSQLTAADELRAFIHPGFWAPMDTLRDKIFLEDQWASGAAPWRIW